MNRRLIRPNLSEIKEKLKAAEIASPKPPPVHSAPPPVHESRGGHPLGSHPQGAHGGPHMPKKVHPPSDTSAESYYYLKQMSKKTAMAVVFNDGETIEGYIEWYDRTCIKLNREGAPNLLVYKNAIKYLYKLDEGKEGGEGETDERR
jgi:sRNA-binding regulator protein Hfq